MSTFRYTPITLAAISLFTAPVFAEQTGASAEKMNTLIVKGYSSPNATTKEYSGDDVITIEPSKDDVNKSLDQLISEKTPGFIHTNSGTSKHNSNNINRGLSDQYTLYLLNGVAFPTSTLGSQNVPNIPMESIAAIEVIRGAQASLYGSSSLTGVINIITKTGEMEDAQINISAGSHNTQRVGGVYANNSGRLQFMTSLDLDKSDGYDFKDTGEDYGYQSYSMNSYAAYVTRTNRFSLALNNSTTELDVNDSNNQDYTQGKAETHQDAIQLTGKYIQQLNKHFSSELTLSTAEVDLDADDYGSSEVDNYKTNETLVQLHLNSEWDTFSTNFGGEYIHSKYKSNDDRNDRDQTALYAAFSGAITHYLNLSGGIRYDNYSDFGNALTYSAGVSLFDMASLSYKTSFTAPSYNDLYWPGAGNPDLASEEGEILELAFTHNIETKHAFIPLKLSLYTGSLDNKISWAEVTPGYWTPSNVDKVSIQGVEVSMQYDANAFVFDISGAYSESIDEESNQQLDNVPEWSGSSSLQYNMTEAIKPKLIYSYIGKRTYSSGELKASHLLDFAVTYQINQHFDVGLNINNLTDNDQQRYAGYNADGRTFLISIGAQM